MAMTPNMLKLILQKANPKLATALGILTDAQKKLEEDIKAINDFNKNTKLKSQLEVHSKDLKAIRKDIKEIKDAVGTRLKL